MKLLRILFFKILYKLRIGHYFLSKNRRNAKVPELVFHKVIPENDPVWPGIHPHVFEEIIKLLKRHYEILPLNHLLSKPTRDLSKACFITFDDGYKDFLDYAYPVLRRHSAPSALFVLPYDLSNRGHIWTSTIIYLVKHYWFDEINAFFLEHKQYIAYGNNYSDAGLNLAIAKHLCKLQQTEREVIIRHLQEKFERDNRIIEKELLTFTELRKLDPAMVDIASHSLTHPSFELENDEDFVFHELNDSKKIIEKELGVEVSMFAFPFATFSSMALSAVKKCYQMCFTRINDFVDLKRLERDKTYLYDLPRFHVHHDCPEEVFFLVNGFHKAAKSALRAGDKDPIV